MAAIGILGAGNMGGAIVQGMIAAKEAPFRRDEIYIYRRTREANERLAEQLDVHAAESVEELIRQCDYILLAVKPAYCAQVLSLASPLLSGKVLISIVTGWTYAMLSEALPADTRIIRVMPNTPLSVGAGMSLIEKGYTVLPEEYARVKAIFACAGEVEEVDERMFNAATGISGCGPAFVYVFIEALADGGVRQGVPREMAYRLAAQTVLGAGKMVLETGMHPGALKDAVCSPGGTTIEGVRMLEKAGMRAAVIDAVGATCEKAERLIK